METFYHVATIGRVRGGTMADIVECVPNFSEGQRPEVVDAIASAIGSVAGVKVLDREADANHNRCVITFIGTKATAVDAALAGARKAVELIDMNRQHGEHPRIGALDVLPFVPISGVTMEECIVLARTAGRRLADELGIPVYLYAAAATRPDRKALANIRQGEYEGLRAEIGTNPERKPDFGAPRMHPTAGAAAVGARPVLIAWNVNLATSDLEVARRIAREIRESSGGFPALQAKGFVLADKGMVQVSMNTLDYRTTDLATVFEAIRQRAAAEGVEIAETEIIGLIPLEALVDGARSYFKIATFDRKQILETRLWE